MFRFESAIFICFKMIRYTDMVNEPHHEKTGFLHMQKNRHRSASFVFAT